MALFTGEGTRGGCLFLENDYRQLQKCLIEIGEVSFVVIENTFNDTLDALAFRLKFPVETTWEELISGNFISAIIFEMHHNEFFVFGESGKWGKYSATDYLFPLDIIGFESVIASPFISHFKISKEENDEILELLPVEYRSRLSGT